MFESCKLIEAFQLEKHGQLDVVRSTWSTVTLGVPQVELYKICELTLAISVENADVLDSGSFSEIHVVPGREEICGGMDNTSCGEYSIHAITRLFVGVSRTHGREFKQGNILHLKKITLI